MYLTDYDQLWSKDAALNSHLVSDRQRSSEVRTDGLLDLERFW